MIDLSDTHACEPAARCAACFDPQAGAVRTATTPVGVICLTLCPACTAAGTLPRIGVAQAVTMSLEHCRHLGITADQMEAAMTPTDHALRDYGADAAGSPRSDGPAMSEGLDTVAPPKPRQPAGTNHLQE